VAGMEKQGREDIEARLLAGWRPRAFVALDFETANRSRSSACALALVRVEGDQIVERVAELIRPLSGNFEFSHLHGITSEDVADKGAFGEVWKTLVPAMEGAQFLAAHNAAFDRDVLATSCRNAGIPFPDFPFVCTVALARLKWKLHPTKLPDVCAFLGLPLRHHDPLSDAMACANIVLASMGRVQRQGLEP